MLRVLRARRRADSLSLFDSFDPEQSTWVVSDLRTKFEFQNHLLERHGHYVDESILRASDLWKVLLKKSRPELRPVSRDFARSLVRSFLGENRERLGLSPVAERSVLGLMDRIAGIVFHPKGPRTIAEWLKANPASLERWGALYTAAVEAFAHLLNQNVIAPGWSAALLQTADWSESLWSRPLVVDLGAELTGPEAQLFRELSRFVDVTLIEPMPSWRQDHHPLFWPYQEITGFSTDADHLADSVNSRPRREVLRFAGQLGEVKEAVSRLRGWADAGIPLSQMAVLAPDIELYWPVLKAHLDEEGLPSEKAAVSKVGGLPGVLRWLARLRARTQRLESPDLELSLFGHEPALGLDYEEFRELFTHLFEAQDLRRHPEVEKYFHAGPSFEGLLGRDAFLASALHFWDRRDDFVGLGLILREVLQNATGDVQLRAAEWVRYFESVAAAKEIESEPAVTGGLTVASLMSARTSSMTHRIYLGLNEENLRRAGRHPLPVEDIHAFSDLGFHLDHPDHSLLEFELRWQADGGVVEDLFFTAMTDFDGSALTPASIWVRLFREVHPDGHEETVRVPAATRWDELRRSSLSVQSRWRPWDEQTIQRREQRIAEDLGEAKPEPWGAPKRLTLSPSRIQKHRDCQFHSASTLFLRLRDTEALDVDMDGGRRGRILHAAFSRMTDENWIARQELAESELDQLLDEARQAERIEVGDERFWPPFRFRLRQTLQRFVKAEKDWKKRFPQMRILPSEQEWKIWFDLATSEFTVTEPAQGIRIAGQIDRLETDGAGAVTVVDYKSSSWGLQPARRWLSDNDLQLLFYTWAVQKGAVQGVQGEVIGAFYYTLRDFTRKLGLQVEGTDGSLFPEGGDLITVSAEEKIQFIAQLEDIVRQSLRETGEGHVNPEPRKQEFCGACSWRDLCRAPHVN